MLYYLHIHSPQGREPDEEGQEHATLDAARDAAIRGLREIVSHGILVGEFRSDEWIEIEDDLGGRMNVVRFIDILNTPFSPEPLSIMQAARMAGANDG